MNIDKIIESLTTKEKCNMVVGKDGWKTFDINRLNIPSLVMADGPHGLRKVIDSSGIHEDAVKAVCYPSLVTLASSFNPRMAYLMGESIAREFKANGVHIILGPGINIKRHPYCGRNFEYFSEDPFVTTKMAEGFIKGAKATGVGVCLKHYALNSQENYRMTSNSIADQKAKYELYYKSFQELVKLDPEMVMCSYNKIDGVYASENLEHLKTVLRDEFGFDGVIVSDWTAVNERTKALIASLDLEMPANPYSNHQLIKAIKQGLVPIETLNQSVERILKLIDQVVANDKKLVDLDKNHLNAAKIAAESFVLLKNDDHILPLKENEKILLVGDMAKNIRYQGGGSSHINAYQVDSIYDVLIKHKNMHYLQGYESNTSELNPTLLDEVKAMAADYDKIVIACGLTDRFESEGFDRVHMSIPKNQSYLINLISSINPNVILVSMMGSPVVMPFIDNTKAILNCYLGGEALGVALNRVLYGEVNPSGRLAETFPISHQDIPSDRFYNVGNQNVYYQESIYVGYRYFTACQKEVLFPFGYGLSYSHFEYNNLQISKSTLSKPTDTITLSVDITNNGPIDGKEVVLLFFEAKSPKIPRPKRELIGFDKIMIKNHETKTVKFKVNIASFKYYHPEQKMFLTDDGVYHLQITKNARDLLVEKSITVNQGVTHPESIWHHLNSYNPEKGLTFKDEDFEELINQKICDVQVKHTRPFTINNNLEDLEVSRLGRFFTNTLLKEAKKEAKGHDDQWTLMMLSSIKQIPIRSIAIMSEGKLKVNTAKAIIAFINHRYLKGIKYLFRKD